MQEARVVVDEETYVVSMAECTIVDENAELLDDIIVAHVIEDAFELAENDVHHDDQNYETEMNHGMKPRLPNDITNSALYDALYEKNWRYARELMDDYCANEGLFTFADKWNGWTALHQACFRRFIPIDLFSDIASFYVSIYGPNLVTDKWGDTALHCACQHSTDDMIMILLNHFPSATSVQNKHGGLPLHTAVHYECSSHIIRKLLNINKNAIHVTNNYGNSPLHRILKTEKYIYPPDILKPDSIPLYGGDHDEICNVLSLLLRSRLDKSIDPFFSEDDDSFFILHDLLKLNAQIHFISLIISKFPKEICRVDEEGNMPIHIAVTLKDNVYRQQVLKNFISKYPHSFRIPDHDGRLPISLAIENKDITTEDLSRIFKECTFASGTRDIKTHLYPFILAAIDSKHFLSQTDESPHLANSEDGDKKQDSIKLEDDQLLQMMTNSYMLLIENPAVLRDCKPIGHK